MKQFIPKLKKCRGSGRAVGNGCGHPKKIHKYGLCVDCFKKWIYDTTEGQKYIKSIQIRSKKYVYKQSINEVHQKSKIRKQKTIELMSCDEYRAKYVQPVFNKIARLIDYGQRCIATGNNGRMNGGHYHSVGSNRTICLNLHNIHIQSYQSNSEKGGDNILYRKGLVNTYGIDYAIMVENLSSIEPIKLTKDDLIRVKVLAQKIAKELEANLTVLSPEERIRKREEINNEIGIYKP